MSQCQARNRSGQQCGQQAIMGASVCYLHGGKAPQVQRKAKERLMLASLPAVAKLIEVMDKADSWGEQRQAAINILDRSGLKPYNEDEARTVVHGDMPIIQVIWGGPELSDPNTKVIDVTPSDVTRTNGKVR